MQVISVNFSILECPKQTLSILNPCDFFFFVPRSLKFYGSAKIVKNHHDDNFSIFHLFFCEIAFFPVIIFIPSMKEINYSRKSGKNFLFWFLFFSIFKMFHYCQKKLCDFFQPRQLLQYLLSDRTISMSYALGVA